MLDESTLPLESVEYSPLKSSSPLKFQMNDQSYCAKVSENSGEQSLEDELVQNNQKNIELN